MEWPTSFFTQQHLWSSLDWAQPTRFAVACVDEDTCFFRPRPKRPFNQQEIELATLEQVQMRSSTNMKPEDLPAHHFPALMERAFEYFPPDCDSIYIPQMYSVILRLRYENGLAVLEEEEEVDLDLPYRAREAFASGHAGPNVPPTTQLEALLDEHARERDNLVEQDVTEHAIHRTTSPSPQPALETLAHPPSMRRFVAIPRKVVLRSSALVLGSLVAEMYFEASRQPARGVTTHQHITLQPAAPVPESSDVLEAVDAAESVNHVDENRVREDKGLPPLKEAHEQSKRAARRQRHRDRQTAPCDTDVFGDIQTPTGQASLTNPAEQPKLSKSAKRRERKRRQQMELDAAVNFALWEDAKYAENESAWDALSSIHDENTAASIVETPMGQAFLRARALALPDPQWAPERIECWLDEVDEDAPDAYDDISKSDEEHPEQDTRIAEGIASGVTRVTLVEGAPEEDLFLRQYPEYAGHEEHWDALSSLQEDENDSDQGSETTKEAIAKAAEVPEAPESNGDPGSQEANEAFFGTAALQSNTQQPVMVIVGNARGFTAVARPWPKPSSRRQLFPHLDAQLKSAF